MTEDRSIIKIVCYDNGIAKLTSNRQPISGENYPAKLVIDFSNTIHKNRVKRVDLITIDKFKRYRLGTSPIVELDLPMEALLPGELIVVPSIRNRAENVHVKYKTDNVVIIRKGNSLISHPSFYGTRDIIDEFDDKLSEFTDIFEYWDEDNLAYVAQDLLENKYLPRVTYEDEYYDNNSGDISGTYISKTYIEELTEQLTDSEGNPKTARRRNPDDPDGPDIVYPLTRANYKVKVERDMLPNIDEAVKDVKYNSTNHKFTFQRYGAPNIEISLPIAGLLKNLSLDNETNELILVLEDGGEVRVPLHALLVGVVKQINDVNVVDSLGRIELKYSDLRNLPSIYNQIQIDTKLALKADLTSLLALQDALNEYKGEVLNIVNNIHLRLEEIERNVLLQDNKIEELEGEFDNYTPKARTIAGLPLTNNISESSLRDKLLTATTSIKGLMSVVDKQRLDSLWDVLEGSEAEAFIDTLRGIIDIFKDFPDEMDILEILGTKVDKEEGKSLFSGDYEDLYNKPNIGEDDTKGDLFTRVSKSETRIVDLNVKTDNHFTNFIFNNETGDLTFVRENNNTKTINIPLELIVESGYYDSEEEELVLVLASEGEVRIPLDALKYDLAVYRAYDSIKDFPSVGLANTLYLARYKYDEELEEVDTTKTINRVYVWDAIAGKYDIISGGAQGGVSVFDRAEEFPESGEEGILYLARFEDTTDEPLNALFVWDKTAQNYLQVLGGGGGSDAALMTFTSVPVDSNKILSHAIGQDLKITVNYQHEEGIPGDLRITRNGTEIFSRGLSLGYTTLDLSSYIRSGNNTLVITVSDGFSRKRLQYNVLGIAVNLSSTYRDEFASLTGDFSVSYRLETEARERKVYVTLNDNTPEEINITTSNNTKQFIDLPHGVHTVTIQGAAVVDGGEEALSNILIFNLISVRDNAPTLISSKFDIAEATQGTRLEVDYVVYNPERRFNDVQLLVDGIQTGLTEAEADNRYYWDITHLTVGGHLLEIRSGGAAKTFNIEILQPEVIFYNNENQLQAYFNAATRTNTDINRRVWPNSFGLSITAYLNDFNYASNGWIDGALLLNGKANIEIPYKPFETSIGQAGKTIEIEFETTTGSELPFIECISNNRGFIIYGDRAVVRSNNTLTEVFFKEHEKTKLSFVIDKPNNFVYIYINGVLSKASSINQQTSFQQSNAQHIKINNNFVEGKLYNIRIYDTALDSQDILNNYLYDITDYSIKLNEYYFSDILNSSGYPDLEKTKEKMPVMVIRTYEKDDEGNSLPQTERYRPYVSVEYEHNTRPEKNFTISNVRIRTQGTSSLQYPVKNYRLYDGDLKSNPVTLNDEMLPASRINLKADYVDSSHSTNVGITRLFDRIMDTPTPPKANDGKSRISIWSEGPTAVFNNDGEDNIFVGVYNLNGDKSDSTIWGFYEEMNFPDARRYEILFNATGEAAVAFRRPQGMGDTDWYEQLFKGFEQHWPKSNDGRDFSDLKYDVPADQLEIKNTYQELAEFVEFISDADLETPEGITAFKEEFVKRAEYEYFVKTLITVYVFGLVDNFGKDLMIVAWDKAVGEDYLKWYTSLYDLDTAIGIDNQGRMTGSDGLPLYDYDMEMDDTTDDGDSTIFAQAESKLWEGIEKAFPDEIERYYAELRNSFYSYNSIWDSLYTKQIKTISKAMYNSNANAKYIEPAGAAEFRHMLNGNRLTQINRWITNRLAYLDSKYSYNLNTENAIFARVETTNPESVEFIVKPIMNMYIRGQLGNSDFGTMSTRATAYKDATLNHTYDSSSGLPFMELSIFNGDKIMEWTNIKDLGIQTLQIGAAKQLQYLDLSREEQGSSLLEEVLLGNNIELKEVNLRNNNLLKSEVNLEGAIRLVKADLRGTSVPTVLFPNGGVLEEIYLPNTIENLEIRNQSYLETIDLASGTELETLVLENTDLDFRDLLDYVKEDGYVRILGTEMSVYGETFLLQLKNKLAGLKGLDAFGGYVDKPVIQGTLRVLSQVNVDPTLLAWYETNLPDLRIEINVFPDTLLYSDEGEYIKILGSTEIGNVPLNIPSKTNAELSILNPVDFTLDNWKDVTEIAASAFDGKTNFTSIALPNTLETINNYAFRGINNITELEIPKSVNYIGIEAFHGLNKVNKLYLHNTLTILANGAFSGLASDAIILVEHNEKPATWNFNWSGSISTQTILWGVLPETTAFRFDTTGGDPISTIINAQYLLEVDVPTPTKFGYSLNKWQVNGQDITFPYVPKTYSEQLKAVWDIWTYEVRYILPDETIYATQYVNYGETLGASFNELQNPTYGYATFKGWRVNGVKIDSTYSPTKDVINENNIIEVRARFLQILGVEFYYDQLSDVYDVVSWEPGYDYTRYSSGEIEIIIPDTYDDGFNGEKPVRHVMLTQSSEAKKDKVGSIKIEPNSLTNRKYNPSGSDNSRNYKYLTTVSLGNIAELGENSFGDAVRLVNLNFGTNLKVIGESAFRNNYLLKDVELPNTLEVIGSQAFSTCRALEYIEIPEGVTEVAGYLFMNNDNLKTVVLPSTITTIGPSAFSSCVLLGDISLPEGLLSIGNGAFLNCTSLTEISIPHSVTSIVDYAFQGAENLEDVYFLRDNIVPKNYAGNAQFSGTNAKFHLTPTQNSTNIVFSGKAITSADNKTLYAYPSASGIVDLELQLPQLETIGWGAFHGTKNITTVTLPNTLTSIEALAFYRSSLTSIEIPYGITKIDNQTFNYCSSLTSITLPESIIQINGFAFQGCTDLVNIGLPNSLEIIADYAFFGCNSLAELEVPSGLTRFGEYSYYNCSSLKDITLLPVVPPTVYSNTFTPVGNPAKTFTVPSGTLDTYLITSSWSTWTNEITE